MNLHLQQLLQYIEDSAQLSPEEKAALLKEIKSTDKELEIVSFKLDRTEKAKRTTAILLEETIAELEQKRKVVEEKARALEIEAALERVRTIAMSMKEPADMLDVCKTISHQLDALGVKEIRNVQTAIFYEERNTYMNYEYYAKHDKTFITETTYTNNEIHHAFALQMLKGNGEFFHSHIEGDKVKDWIAYQKTTNVFIDEYLTTAPSLNYYWHSLGEVALGISTYEPLSEGDLNLFKRFLKVFELAYRRYLDIEQANAQAREAQIQLALERVRARTMAMQNSNELTELVTTVFRELTKLHLSLTRCAIVIMDADASAWTEWTAEIDRSAETYRIKDAGFPYHRALTEAWKERRPEWTYHLKGDEMRALTKYLITESGYSRVPEPVKEIMLNTPAIFLSHSFANFGYIRVDSLEPTAEENLEIISRFASVFDLTYTRFNDLKQAEAQARESQIQLALERVRARTMAMQKSDELAEVAVLLFQQVRSLGIPSYTSGFTVWENDGDVLVSWMCNADGSVNPPFRMPTNDNAWHREQYQSWKNGKAFLVHDFTGEDMQAYYRYLRSFSLLDESFKQSEAAGVKTPERQVHNVANFSHGNLLFITLQPCPEAYDLFKRFATVFDQTYTRFLDLQKAEAQAREAQIEVALERVRARAMTMQTSDELNELIGTVFAELTKLDLVLTRCVIIIYEGDEKGVRWWMANSETPSKPMNFFVKYADMPFFNEYLKGWQNRTLKWQYILEGENKIKTDDFLFHKTELSQLPDFVIAGMRAPQRVYLNASFNNFGNLTLASLEPLSDEHFDILLRFAKVFDLTYTRFNDLQKAEAQAREAQIEAALERVRAKAMSMQNSTDVGEAIGVTFTELEKLGIVTLRCGIFIIDSDNRTMEVWTAINAAEGKVGQVSGWLSVDIHPMLQTAFDAWQRKETNLSYELAGDDLMAYAKAIADSASHYQMPPETIRLYSQIYSAFFFNEGALFTFTAEPLSTDSVAVLLRFAAVFGHTYRRYLDLRNAEEQARLAIQQASIDRVRAEIASMRSTEDLRRITPLLWHELHALQVSFVRCGVFIMNEAAGTTQAFLASPDGKQLGVLNLSIHNSAITETIADYWRKGLVYTEHWSRKQFVDWMQSLIEKKQIESADVYQGEVDPYENLYLHFVPFKQGMLYVGNTELLSESELQLVKSLADAFSIAYARYDDFRQLEATLDELQKTQQQLIQAEKMASLGELTAGIAHEIQNPLNFVNNFSEVNKELLDELRAALKKGETEEAWQLSAAVQENLEKVAHHGMRADAIVKSMLQHSRKSGGQKLPTDINQLAGEYLRLSYHGLRAKNPGFNAAYETAFDEGLTKIAVVPQDIGRVLLNLFNNAFYAVHEKKKQLQSSDYDPLVRVTTRCLLSAIEIQIKDNGTGMSPAVAAKIFQPFYTTKPTGEGTGLGLSLSYEIITKGHGGEIRVETKEGEGSDFIIILPLQS